MLQTPLPKQAAQVISRVQNPLKWHGGKFYLAQRVVALMPPHLHYVEPYAGGLSVLLYKDPEGVSEVVNDLHGELTNFWNVLKSSAEFDRFYRVIQATPFSEVEWNAAKSARSDDPVERAVNFFVLCRQSHSGRMQYFAALTRNRTRRKMNEQASAWLTAVEGLPEVHNRLRRVVILNRKATDVIKEQDGPNTLFYLDPPYVHETRVSIDSYGEHEMSIEEHENLLRELSKCQGKFLLSMYKHEMYHVYATQHNWRRVDFDLPNNAAGGEAKRRMIECVWMNFDPS